MTREPFDHVDWKPRCCWHLAMMPMASQLATQPFSEAGHHATIASCQQNSQPPSSGSKDSPNTNWSQCQLWFQYLASEIVSSIHHGSGQLPGSVSAILQCTNELENSCDALAVVLYTSTGALVLVIAPLVRTRQNWLFHCKNKVLVLHLHAVVHQLPTKSFLTELLYKLTQPLIPLTQHILLPLQRIWHTYIPPCTTLDHALQHMYVLPMHVHTQVHNAHQRCNAICKIMFIVLVMLQ